MSAGFRNVFEFLKKHWFIAGLLLVVTLTVADGTEVLSGAGKWLKMHNGPDAVIVLIFFSTGLILDTGRIKAGLGDFEGIAVALAVIFLFAPLCAAVFGILTLDKGIKIGFFLVAVMPTTLSSGVVMTGASGGNMAHALVITLAANALAVFTIPVSLSLLLSLVGGSAVVSIDKAAIMLKLALLVLLPLACGLALKHRHPSRAEPLAKKLQIINQSLVLVIVWMAVSQAKNAILADGETLAMIAALVFVFHGALLAVSGILTRAFNIGIGRRESVIFMGGQKTLPLSVILQVSLFPQFGLALVVCVLHHMLHLIMDGYLVGVLKKT